MQCLLTALDIFCLMFDMQVNMGKTQGIVFHME
jgi:hypothetical protein